MLATTIPTYDHFYVLKIVRVQPIHFYHPQYNADVQMILIDLETNHVQKYDPFFYSLQMVLHIMQQRNGW